MRTYEYWESTSNSATKQQKFLSCDYVLCKASHRVVCRRSYERKQMYQNVWCNIEKFLFCLTTLSFDVKVTVMLLKLPNTHTYCTCPHVQSLGWIHLQNSTAICVCCKWSTLGFRLWLRLISFINVNIDAFVPVVNYLSNYIETSRYIRSSSMPAIAISITPVAIWAPRPHGHILKNNTRALETVQTVIWKPCCGRLIYPGEDAW